MEILSWNLPRSTHENHEKITGQQDILDQQYSCDVLLCSQEWSFHDDVVLSAVFSISVRDTMTNFFPNNIRNNFSLSCLDMHRRENLELRDSVYKAYNEPWEWQEPWNQ
jgi:hypothetical protein